MNEKFDAIISIMIVFLLVVMTIAVASGFIVGMAGLVGAVGIAEIVRYGFATLAFAVLIPTITTVLYRRK